MKETHYAQTKLSAEDTKALKSKSGETSIRYGIIKAVEHYLKCGHIETDLRIRKSEPNKDADLESEVFASTMFFVADLGFLKEKTGVSTVKGSLAKAVGHFLECKFTEEDS